MSEGEENGLRTHLNDDLAGAAALQDFKDVNALGQAFIDLKRYQGQSIRIPGEDAGEEDRKAFVDKLTGVDGVMLKPNFEDPDQSKEFWRTLGAPEAADGYEFTPSEDLKDAPINQKMIDEFRNLALDAGVTKSQFAKIVDKMVRTDVEAIQAAQTAAKEDIDSLKQEWGMAYDQNMKYALATARATDAPPEVVEALKSGTAGSAATKWMYSLSKQLGGEGVNLAEHDGQSLKLTPAELQEKVDAIMNNREHPYWDSAHPQHNTAIKAMLDLQSQLYPG